MHKKLLITLSCVFVSIEIVLHVLIFTTSGLTNSWVSFSSIVTAFLFSLLLLSFDLNVILTQIALCTTVMADLFLIIVEPMNQLVAMLFFSVTQVCYFLRLYFNSKSKLEKIVHLFFRGLAIVLIVILALVILKDKVDALSIVSVFYFANLVLNMIFAFVQIKKSILFPIGLLFFMICDIFVGLQSAIGVYLDIPESNIIYQIAFSSFNWAWLFYVPAQVLIVLSLVFNRYPKKVQNTTKMTIDNG